MIMFDKKDADIINNLILSKDINEKELILLDRIYNLIKQKR